MFTPLQNLIAAGAVAAGALLPVSAFAETVTVSLVRSPQALVNDQDPSGGGLWQYEGGVVNNTAGAAIGHYVVTRRVFPAGTSADNTAADTTTLFFPGAQGNAPNVITLEGSWSYTSGQFAGSVSAASNRYHIMIGSNAQGTSPSSGVTQLVISQTGTFSVP